MTDTRRDLLLWTVVLAPPIIWLLSFEAVFALAPWACTFQTKLALYLVSLCAFLIEAGSGALAWRQWKKSGREWATHAGRPLYRGRFMAIGGLVFSAGFATIVVAQAIPALVLGACE
jgi:hypothetical protein